MEKITEFLKGIISVKPGAVGLIGMIGSIIANSLGGWDMALRTLIMFMAVDYIMGLIVAGVFKNSSKTENGALEGKAGFKGLCKKGVVLLIVLVATQLDLLTGTNIIRNAVIIGYITNELVSIAENVGLMGLPFPESIQKALEMLRKKEGV